MPAENQDGPRGGIVGVFDRAADTYDEVGVEWFGPIAAGLVQALDPQPGERALDIGCGKGAALLRLAEAVGPGGRVTGIDLAPRMVERASAAAAARGLTNVDVLVGDASAPDLPADAFDVVASSLVLFFLPDPAAAVAAWRALLRPGGRLGITTFGSDDPAWREVGELFDPYLPPRTREARTTSASGPFASDEGMATLLRDAGLVDVRTVTTILEAELRDEDQWYEFTWSHGQRAAWECVPEDERESVRRAAGDVLARLRPAGQPIRFSEQVRYTLGERPKSS